jgi:tRNA(Ile)-lysidine synthase
LIRPLLDISRAEVLRYLAEKGLPHRTDSTNADNRFLRNSIRHYLVPLLDERFPRWRGSLGALGETQRLTADFHAAEAVFRLPWEKTAGKEFRTGTDNFFSQPPIIREEALFLGIDKLLSPAGKDGAENPVPVKRSNLRSFSRGDCTALDLGFCRIRKTASHVVISGGRPGAHEAGFSLLIKEPGLYKLERVTIELLPGYYLKDEEAAAKGFFVSLPLVFRRSFRDDYLALPDRKISAVDLKGGADMLPLCAADFSGIAAFIGMGPGGAVILLRRDVSGGLNGARRDGRVAGTYYCKVL